MTRGNGKRAVVIAFAQKGESLQKPKCTGRVAFQGHSRVTVTLCSNKTHCNRITLCSILCFAVLVLVDNLAESLF